MKLQASVVLLLVGAAALASAASTPPLDNFIHDDAKPDLMTKNEKPEEEDTQPIIMENEELKQEDHTISKREAIQGNSGDDENEDSGVLDAEGRSRRRKGLVKKVVWPVFLTIGLMTVPVLFGLVALAAFKGLWSGMTALAVTAALALRRLLSSNHSVWVPPPPPPPAPHHITEYYADYRRADDYNNRFGWRALQ